MIDITTLASAFLLGLAGSAHCMGMCGGLSVALGLYSNPSPPGEVPSSDSSPKSPSQLGKLITYNTGRIVSYSLAGLIVGLFGFWLSQQIAGLLVLRYLAAVMLILLGCYLAQWFNALVLTEKLGHLLWKKIQPLSKRFLPIHNLRDAFLVGLVWGWLPCGLVYSALIWSSLQASLAGSALVMICFGLGTLPSMLATGIFAQRMSNTVKHPRFRTAAGVLMVVFGISSLPFIQQLFLSNI